CGDIQSIREWIVDGENGLLVDPCDPNALANAILMALDHADMRSTAAHRNAQIIREKAGVDAARSKVKELYERPL
ncbi:MAG: glycosyl transferase family 1, partial [Anaerolinea sp.]|nr:glycosyl transferase family 1 [Anaerolinea sp.]